MKVYCVVVFINIILCIHQLHAQEVAVKDYCVVGAGPSGLQMGHFLEKAGRDYILLERSDHSGSFFDRMPRHGKLISINKRWSDSANTEYTLRHDWNSLLSDDDSLLLKHYSHEFLPHRDVYVRYLNDFQKKLNIKVDFNTNVKGISKIDSKFLIKTVDGKKTYNCSVVVMATGVHVPAPGNFPGSELAVSYDKMSLNKSDYEGKRVLIVGKGNSGFETAQHIYGNTAFVHMIGRQPVRLSWSTHYVGDLRAVNNDLLDTYQLKSLDGMLESDRFRLSKLQDGRIHLGMDTTPMGANVDVDQTDTNGYSYDIVIKATGWTWDANVTKDLKISSVRHGKYPKISHQYESSQVANLFFAGTMTHSLDFRLAAGGFIHGFRYTTRALHRYLEARRHGVPWPVVEGPILDLVDALVKRINEGSGNYQMYSFLSDVVLINKDKTSFKLIPEFPVKTLHILPRITKHEVEGDIFVFIFEYGRNFSGPRLDTFGEDRAGCSPMTADKCNFLHPVIYHYKELPTKDLMYNQTLSEHKLKLPEPVSTLHLAESFFTFFRENSNHIAPLVAYLENALGLPMEPLSAERCTLLALSHSQVPSYCTSMAKRWSFNEMAANHIMAS